MGQGSGEAGDAGRAGVKESALRGERGLTTASTGRAPSALLVLEQPSAPVKLSVSLLSFGRGYLL